MATQLLNADAMLVSVQELLGHNNIVSTQRPLKIRYRHGKHNF